MGLDVGSLVTSAISGIVSPVATFFTRKAEISAAQHVADLKAVQAQGDRAAALISQGLAADANWELESLRAGQGWARNFELIVVSVPMIMCFTKYSYIVKAGFDALSQTPVWFQTMAATIFFANYGIRLWRRNQSDT